MVLDTTDLLIIYTKDKKAKDNWHSIGNIYFSFDDETPVCLAILSQLYDVALLSRPNKKTVIEGIKDAIDPKAEYINNIYTWDELEVLKKRKQYAMITVLTSRQAPKTCDKINIFPVTRFNLKQNFDKNFTIAINYGLRRATNFLQMVNFESQEGRVGLLYSSWSLINNLLFLKTKIHFTGATGNHKQQENVYNQLYSLADFYGATCVRKVSAEITHVVCLSEVRFIRKNAQSAAIVNKKWFLDSIAHFVLQDVKNYPTKQRRISSRGRG